MTHTSSHEPPSLTLESLAKPGVPQATIPAHAGAHNASAYSLYRILDNLADQRNYVVGVERRLATKQLIQNDSEGP
jgi:hypothetical protein